MAIVHIAIFDAVNAIAGGYRSYGGLPLAPRGTSMRAAIAQAAHDTLAEKAGATKHADRCHSAAAMCGMRLATIADYRFNGSNSLEAMIPAGLAPMRATHGPPSRAANDADAQMLP